MDRAEERDVALPQLEHGPGADGPGEHRVADQGPGLLPAQLAIVLKTKTNQHLCFKTITFLRFRWLVAAGILASRDSQ